MDQREEQQITAKFSSKTLLIVFLVVNILAISLSMYGIIRYGNTLFNKDITNLDGICQKTNAQGDLEDVYGNWRVLPDANGWIEKFRVSLILTSITNFINCILILFFAKNKPGEIDTIAGKLGIFTNAMMLTISVVLYIVVFGFTNININVNIEATDDGVAGDVVNDDTAVVNDTVEPYAHLNSSICIPKIFKHQGGYAKTIIVIWYVFLVISTISAIISVAPLHSIEIDRIIDKRNAALAAGVGQATQRRIFR